MAQVGPIDRTSLKVKICLFTFSFSLFLLGPTLFIRFIRSIWIQDRNLEITVSCLYGCCPQLCRQGENQKASALTHQPLYFGLFGIPQVTIIIIYVLIWLPFFIRSFSLAVWLLRPVIVESEPMARRNEPGTICCFWRMYILISLFFFMVVHVSLHCPMLLPAMKFFTVGSLKIWIPVNFDKLKNSWLPPMVVSVLPF